MQIENSKAQTKPEELVLIFNNRFAVLLAESTTKPQKHATPKIIIVACIDALHSKMTQGTEKLSKHGPSRETRERVKIPRFSRCRDPQHLTTKLRLRI